MQALRRSAAKAAQTARTSLPRQSRRYAHDAHHGNHGAQHIEYPADEPLGKGFYIAVGAIPVSIAVYYITGINTDKKPFFTRLIESYSYYKDIWAERNKLHTDAIEQAAVDRHLFLNSSPRRHFDLRFPEAFNTGSPFNVSAGSQADISKVIAHYEKLNYEEQAKKLEDLKNGTLKAEQAPKPVKNPPSP